MIFAVAAIQATGCLIFVAMAMTVIKMAKETR